MPIIISDVSPTLHMLWSAAVTEGNGAIWWQDDYHHSGPLPQPVVAAVILNQDGLKAVRGKSPEAFVVARDQTPVEQIRAIPTRPRVGVATNAFFLADVTQRRYLNDVLRALGASMLRIRLHPNSRLTAEDFPEPWIEVALPNELLDEFTRTVDFVIVGNSAVQLRLLCEGVPVVHIPGMDPHGFDSYGYVKRGFCFGIERVQSIDVVRIRAFYADPALKEKIRAYVSVSKDEYLGSLSDFARSDLMNGQSKLR